MRRGEKETTYGMREGGYEKGNEEVTKRGQQKQQRSRIRLWPQIYFLGLYGPGLTDCQTDDPKGGLAVGG